LKCPGNNKYAALPEQGINACLVEARDIVLIVDCGDGHHGVAGELIAGIPVCFVFFNVGVSVLYVCYYTA